MSDITKRALKDSLKHMMKKKPLDRITIADITNDCGVSRMAFYYHFRDIYDLVEWTCLEEARAAMAGRETASTWQEGLERLFSAVLASRDLILNAYRNMPREKMERFLLQLTYGLILGVVEEKSRGIAITETDRMFIADFYKYSFVGVLLHWIEGSMQDDYHVLARRIGITLHGNVANSIRNFAESYDR